MNIQGRTLSSFMQGRGHTEGRSPSPQNASNAQRSTSATRALNAAQARVPIKQLDPQSPIQSNHGLPSRGFAIAHPASGAVSRAPSRTQYKQEQQHDAFDTDVESLDTTLDQSVLAVGTTGVEYQHRHVAYVAQPDHEMNPKLDEDPEESAQHSEIGDGSFTSEQLNFLERNGMLHLSHTMRIDYLRNIGGHLPTVEGDSYPETTNGDYTEDIDDQEHAGSREEDAVSQPSPSPQHRTRRTDVQSTRQTQSQFTPKTSNIIQQSARLRDQERRSNILSAQDRVNEMVLDKPQASHSATHGQTNRGPAISRFTFVDPRPGYTSRDKIPVPREEQASVRFVSQTAPAIIDAPRQALLISQTNPETTARIDSAAERTLDIPAILEDRDYDDEVLFAMDYSQLKNEAFDVIPRAHTQTLEEDVQNKSLPDRLEYVQKNVEVARHSEFFHSLPTAEWEEAGDWFLDQFSTIIQQSKQARQKKRQFVKDFEEEIEQRQKYVARKQQHVEAAMSKMKAQGEGLVPRTPLTTKGPKSKKK